MFTLKTVAVATAKAAVIVAALAYAQEAHATPVTQTTAPGNSDSYASGNGSNWQRLGRVTLAASTNKILDIASTVTLVDQGFGGQANTNGVRVDLFVNGADVWGQYVAGATHSWATQTYDLATSPADLSALNASLGSVAWSTAPTVTIDMNATPWGYPAWALHTNGAVFSVVSDTVPVQEPMSIVLLGTALIGAIVVRRAKPAKRIERKNQREAGADCSWTT